MLKRISVVIAAMLCGASVYAQAVWSRAHLDDVKTQLGRPMYAQAYAALVAEADTLLGAEPMAVTMKRHTAPSGDRHDYVSLARYFHPDTTKADGLPYVNRDGITNPEINLWDRNRLGATAHRVATLALAYHFSDDERYATKAAELLKVWFLNPATRMNPNLEYAQMVPGLNGGKGRCYGVLDGYSLVEMLDGVALLEGSRAWTRKDSRRMRQWVCSLLDWILTSPQGMEEARQANNHSTACDALTVALAIYAGREHTARRVLADVPSRRIFTQIEPDGTQPHEMWRTLSYGYSQYNLTHMIDMFLMAQKLGMRIDNATDADGRSFYKALDLLASYLGRPAAEWPGQQIHGWDEKQQDVVRDLWRVASVVDTTRTDYKLAYQSHRIFSPSDRFTLLYYTPDTVDDAYASAAISLDHAMRRVWAARREAGNAAARRVSPRSVNADGTLALVHPHDWTSGFFPGELWQMYAFTRDPRWREAAVSHTWPIEEAKLHGGTHDLGFMIGDSFGKALELTGEQSYYDVVRQAARTLCTRFNPAVGAIRSWDHNADRWQHPVIIDNMMNLEMLFKMALATGDDSFRSIAVSHADATLRNHFRPDCSSYHVVDYDPSTGNVRMKVTAQGHADDSFWSRGQAWGLYGYTMCYRYTADPRYLDHAQGIADWFLSLPNMPSDRIPYWDMKAPGAEVTDNPAVARDASAAAVIASGLYELADYVDAEKAAYYRRTACKILDSLSAGYAIDPGSGEGFLLTHSTGHHPAGSEIDVPIVYADYYYLEALARARRASLGLPATDR